MGSSLRNLRITLTIATAVLTAAALAAPASAAEAQGAQAPAQRAVAPVAASPAVGTVETGQPTMISKPTAPSRYEVAAGLPAGATLSQVATGYVLRDAAGQTLAELPNPSATDAAGSAVPATFELSQSRLVVVVDHVSAVHPVLLQPLGATCRNWSCGWSFSKSQTTALFGALVAGGTAAALAACARFGLSPGGVVCVGAVSFVAFLVAQGVLANNRCLYISLTVPGRHQLYNC